MTHRGRITISILGSPRPVWRQNQTKIKRENCFKTIASQTSCLSLVKVPQKKMKVVYNSIWNVLKIFVRNELNFLQLFRRLVSWLLVGFSATFTMKYDYSPKLGECWIQFPMFFKIVLWNELINFRDLKL